MTQEPAPDPRSSPKPAPGNDEPAVAAQVADRWLARVERLYPTHRVVFIVAAAGLSLVNLVTGPPWWSFWPVAVAAVVFLTHYLVWKSNTVGERWADLRAHELTERSYDKPHIDMVVDRYTPPAPKRPRSSSPTPRR